jgi:hypothetical protein
MSLIGGVGMVGVSIFQPVIGRWLDAEKTKASAAGLTGDAMELAAGQATLSNIAIIPAALTIAFVILFFTMRKKQGAGNAAH